MRITDGDLQKSYCGDKVPTTFVSKGNVIEIAFSVVDMHREDRGVFYRFTYEASKPGLTNRARGTRRPSVRRTKPQIPQKPHKQQQQQGQQHNQQHQLRVFYTVLSQFYNN